MKSVRCRWGTVLRQAAIAGLYLAPNLLGFLVFTLFPVLAVFVMILFRGNFFDFRVDQMSTGDGWRTFVRDHYVGADNLRRLLSDGDFWRYVGNTLFLMVSIPLHMALSLLLALLLNRKLRGRVAYRTLFFLPTISAGVAIYIVWILILNPEFGQLNTLLRACGVEWLWGRTYAVANIAAGWLGAAPLPGEFALLPCWLTSEFWAKPSLMLMGLWMGMGGYTMVLYLAGLQGIDPSLYEAAGLDGATPGQKFRHVTWPLLSPTTFFIFITSVIGGFQVFDQAFVMTGGGPQGATTTILYHIYNYLYVYQDLGYAATISVALFAGILAVTLLNWVMGKKLVIYD